MCYVHVRVHCKHTCVWTCAHVGLCPSQYQWSEWAPAPTRRQQKCGNTYTCSPSGMNTLRNVQTCLAIDRSHQLNSIYFKLFSSFLEEKKEDILFKTVSQYLNCTILWYDSSFSGTMSWEKETIKRVNSRLLELLSTKAVFQFRTQSDWYIIKPKWDSMLYLI